MGGARAGRAWYRGTVGVGWAADWRGSRWFEASGNCGEVCATDTGLVGKVEHDAQVAKVGGVGRVGGGVEIMVAGNRISIYSHS